MKILFVHENMPGQYRHLAPALAAMPGNEVVFVTQRRGVSLPGVSTHAYRPHRSPGDMQHRYLRDTEAGVLNGQAVAKLALGLKRAGFVPDVMLGHNAWGETWYLKDVFPNSPLVGYFEFFYRAKGADADFDPAQPLTVDDGPRLRTKNLGNLLGLQVADWGQCPMAWQCSTYPELYRPKLKVIHDGIDTGVAKPDANARLELPGTDVMIDAGDEVVTYVARNLEPYRGFPSFMRSLPRVLAQCPRAWRWRTARHSRPSAAALARRSLIATTCGRFVCRSSCGGLGRWGGNADELIGLRRFQLFTQYLPQRFDSKRYSVRLNGLP